jgi:4a-hydroxytetrahydrobiopterin dehydratase
MCVPKGALTQADNPFIAPRPGATLVCTCKREFAMTAEKLSAAEIDERIAVLNNHPTEPWAVDGDAIAKTFRFADFHAAFAFMTRVALVAEKIDHHPDWKNVWNRVEVRLSTHDAGGITGLDFRLASAMETAARQVV